FMLDLYHNYYGLAKKTIYNIVCNWADVEDLTADTFIKLFEKIPTLRKLSCHKTTTYIVYTCRSTAIDFIKHRDVVSRKVDLFNDFDEMSDKTPDNAVPFEDGLIDKIDMEALCGAVFKLPEEQRDILYFKYFLEMPDNEIAEAFGLSPRSIGTYLSRARKAARKLMGKEMNKNDG
ncbi:MAG: sigma-70 family RNA polymerase sigma factor, partial [Clostridiales bacterium]|nr:sigma-70 family RNA polymerase sigma factor [Clostridiales bacterium]